MVRIEDIRDIPLKVIESQEQYDEYSDLLMEIIMNDLHKDYEEQLSLLRLLIKDWDNRQFQKKELDPVEVIKLIMKQNDLSQTNLAREIGISRSIISEIVNYKRKPSKDFIRNFCNRFKISQESLNRKYVLKGNKVDFSEIESTVQMILEDEYSKMESEKEPTKANRFILDDTANLQMYDA